MLALLLAGSGGLIHHGSGGLIHHGASTRRAVNPPSTRIGLSPRAELGLQFDPVASAGSIFVLGGFTALQLKIRYAMGKREERDAAAETYRKAEVLLLAGKLDAEGVERAKAGFRDATAEYDEARQIITLGGALLRIPDPGAAAAERLMGRESGSSGGGSEVAEPVKRPPERAVEAAQTEADPLDGVREALGLKRPDMPPSSSLLPTGANSVTLKDVAIGIAFVFQVAWFLLSLTDPVGAPNPILSAALTAGGNMVDEREGRRAAASAEYEAMLREAERSGEAPPRCATRKLGDPLGGCAPDGVGDAPLLGAPGGEDLEFTRTRGLDASRGWISGPTS